MKKKSKTVHFLLTLALCGSTVASAADFYVDPVSGNNANNGTSPATAFKTLEQARQAVDLVNAGMTEDITVHLRGGIHRLSATLALGPADSGTNGFDVVYRNYGSEVPVINGGVDLSGGWVLHDAAKNIYKKTGVTTQFRQLTVNASSTIRSRTPNQTDPDTLGPYLKMDGINAAAQEAIVNRPDVEGWRSVAGLANVEMVMHPHWYQYRGRIDPDASYQNATQVRFKFQSPENGSIFAKGDDFWNSATYPVPYFFENSIDFLDAEGEWFHDTASSTLYYKPRPGEYMPSATIEAPVLERLIQITGGSSTNKVRNVRFEGLTFTQTGWNGPSIKGSAMTQGAREFVQPYAKHGAITAQFADNIDIAFCKFRFLGFTAISYVKGVTGGAIRNCDFRWLSGNGIVIHDDGTKNPAEGDTCQNIRIVNNGIYRFGQQYSNGIGIVSYFVKRMLIADNEICYSSYMGTQTGGQSGGHEDVGMKDNILRNNYVHHVMQFHDDGAAFYTLARQQGTHVVDNWADTILWTELTGYYPVAGIYADNYSEFITYERNANVNCTKAINQNVSGGVQNIRLINNYTTAEPTITQYAGRKTNYVWPTKIEAENMTITGGTAESGEPYANDAGITFSAAGNLSTTFAGAAGTYNIHMAYVTGDTAAASYRLRVNGVTLDTWAAELTPPGTGLQIRHRIERAVALAAGAVITLEITSVPGPPAKVDYVEIYGRQLSTPLAPESLTANAVSATKIALAWDGWTGESTSATYDIVRATSLAGPFTTIATGVTGTTWMDSQLVQGTPYFYKVTMTTALGTSPDSETVSATPQPSSSINTLESSADAFVRAGTYATINYGTTATQLVVKNATTADNYRKGYIRFDLTGQDINATPNASLQFVVASPWVDATPLQVYGLKNADAGESWVESSITWNNAPANTTASGDGLVSSRVVLLGTLASNGAQPLGKVLELRSAALDAFLLADTDNQVTFILTRASTASGNSVVASRESTTFAAPALVFDRSVPGFIEDNANTQRYESSTTATTNTISNFTVPSGSYRKLVLTASWEEGNPATISSATWNGSQNFTVAVKSATGRNAAILYLDDPTPGTGNIVVTFAAATQSRVGVLSLVGAARGVARTSTSSGISGSLAVPVNGSLVTGVYTSNGPTTGSLPTITGPFASTLYNGDSGSCAGDAGYEIVPTAGSANYTWTVSAPVADNHSLAAFVPAAAAPVIITTSPADNATDVTIAANLIATFSEPVVKGTGTVTLKKTSDNSTVESFNIATSPALTISGQTLTINPTNDLSPGVSYYVLIDSTAIVDSSGGHAFVGISSTTAWNFTIVLPTFASWISNPSFGLAVADRDLADDPDDDGIDNGVENFFGTHPGTFTQGLAAGIKNGNSFTFTHPQNAPPASDLTASYSWSKDLSTFLGNGATDGAGTTVNFTTQANFPSSGITTVTATVTGTATSKLFVQVKVTQP